MKRLLLMAGLLAAVVLAGGEAFAQTGTARGKVLDEAGNGIVDAKVILEFQGGVSRHYETKTNKKGEFTQVGLFPGDYKIMAGKDGYAPGGMEQKIGIGEVTYLPDIKLADAKKVAEAQDEGMVPTELSPIAAASALAAMLERMAAFHADLEVYGASRADVVETTARIVFQTCTGRTA